MTEKSSVFEETYHNYLAQIARLDFKKVADRLGAEMIGEAACRKINGYPPAATFSYDLCMQFNIDINYQILLDSKHELALSVFPSRERFLKGVLMLIFLTSNEYSIA
jgi:hypothetical protein